MPNGTMSLPLTPFPGMKDSIKCLKCLIKKNQHAFHHQHLITLHFDILRKNPNLDTATTGGITCIACLPQQVVELRCDRCEIWKGRDCFSNIQASKGENAICKKCIQAEFSNGVNGINADKSSDGEANAVESDESDDQ